MGKQRIFQGFLLEEVVVGDTANSGWQERKSFVGKFCKIKLEGEGVFD
jgi:hypothetical protein